MRSRHAVSAAAAIVVLALSACGGSSPGLASPSYTPQRRDMPEEAQAAVAQKLGTGPW